MKKLTCILFLPFVIAACQKTDTSHDHHDMDGMESDSTNIILYNQVDDIHREVMPKMEDLYNLKKEMQGKLTAIPAPTAEEKKLIEAKIANIDSVSNMMMDWMHQFNPPADTTDPEQIRAYLELEMEKVKQVRDAIQETLKEK